MIVLNDVLLNCLFKAHTISCLVRIWFTIVLIDVLLNYLFEPYTLSSFWRILTHNHANCWSLNCLFESAPSTPLCAFTATVLTSDLVTHALSSPVHTFILSKFLLRFYCVPLPVFTYARVDSRCTSYLTLKFYHAPMFTWAHMGPQGVNC